MANNIQADQNSDFFSGVNALLGIKDKDNWKYYHTQQYTYRYVSNTTPVYGVYSHFFDYAAKGTSLIQGQIIILYSAKLEELLKKKLKYNKKNYSPYDGNDIKLLVHNQEAWQIEKSILNFRDVLFPGYTRSAAISGEPLTLIIDFIARKTDEYEDIQGFKNLETFISEYEVKQTEIGCIKLNNLTSVIYPYSYTFSGIPVDFPTFNFEKADYKFPDACPNFSYDKYLNYYLNNNEDNYTDTSKVTNTNFDPDSIDLNDLKGQDSRFIEWKKAIENTDGIEKYKTDYLNLLNNVKITNEQIILYKWHFDMLKNKGNVINRLYDLKTKTSPTPEDLETCITDGDTIKFDDESSIRILFYNTFETSQGILENAAAKQQQHYLQILLSRYLARDPYCTDIELKLAYSKINPKDVYKRDLGIILLTKTFQVPKYVSNVNNFNSLFHYSGYLDAGEISSPPYQEIAFKTIKLNFILNLDLLLLTSDQRLALQIVSDYPQQYFGCQFPRYIESLKTPLGMWRLQQLENIPEKNPIVNIVSSAAIPNNTKLKKISNPNSVDLSKLEYPSNFNCSNKILNFTEIIKELGDNKINFDLTNFVGTITNISISDIYNTYLSPAQESFIINTEKTLENVFEKLKEETGFYKGYVILKKDTTKILIKLTGKNENTYQGDVHIFENKEDKIKYIKHFRNFFNISLPNYNFQLKNPDQNFTDYFNMYNPIVAKINYPPEKKPQYSFKNTGSIFNYNSIYSKVNKLKYSLIYSYFTDNFTKLDIKFNKILLFSYIKMDLSKFIDMNKKILNSFTEYTLLEEDESLISPYIYIPINTATLLINLDDYSKYLDQKCLNLNKIAYHFIKTDKTLSNLNEYPLKVKFLYQSENIIEKVLYKNSTNKLDAFTVNNGILLFNNKEFLRFTKDQFNDGILLINLYIIREIENYLIEKFVNIEDIASINIFVLRESIYTHSFESKTNITIDENQNNQTDVPKLSIISAINTKDIDKKLKESFLHFFDDVKSIFPDTFSPEEVAFKKEMDKELSLLSRYLMANNYYNFFYNFKQLSTKIINNLEKEDIAGYIDLFKKSINTFKDNKYLKCFLNINKIFLMKTKANNVLVSLISTDSISKFKGKLINLSEDKIQSATNNFLSSITKSIGNIKEIDLKEIQFETAVDIENFCRKLDSITDKSIKIINQKTTSAKEKLKYNLANSFIGGSK